MKSFYGGTVSSVAVGTGFRLTNTLAICKYCNKQYSLKMSPQQRERGTVPQAQATLKRRMIGHYEYHIRHRPDKASRKIKDSSHGFKKYDHVVIIGAKKNDPNGKGLVEKVGEKGVYISNMNMPYYGTYAMKFVPFSKVRKAGRK